MTTWPTATDPSDEKCLADVRQYGWHVVKILETGDTPQWCFTVGLHRSFGHPEIITFGLPLDTGHAVLNIAGSAAKSGRRFTTGTPYDDFLDGYPCELRTVDPVWYRWFVGYAMWFYGGEPFPLLQLFWPDRHGTFPWAAAPDHWLRSEQPLLYEADEVAAGAGPLLDTLR